MKEQKIDDFGAHLNKDSIAMGEYSKAIAKSDINKEIIDKLSNLKGMEKVKKLYSLIEDAMYIHNSWGFERRLEKLNELDTTVKEVLADKDLQEIGNIYQFYVTIGNLFLSSVTNFSNSISAEVNNNDNYLRDNERLDHIEALKELATNVEGYFLKAYELKTHETFAFTSNYPEGKTGEGLRFVADLLQKIQTMYNTEHNKHDPAAKYYAASDYIAKFGHEQHTTIDAAGEVKNLEEDQE